VAWRWLGGCCDWVGSGWAGVDGPGAGWVGVDGPGAGWAGAVTWRALPSPPADREPRRVADSLERIAASIGAPRPSLLTAVFAGWAELVGPDVAAHATPRSLRDGVLIVGVDHPAWATSLRLLSADLLRRIAPHGEVTELVVHVDGPGRDRLPRPPDTQAVRRPAPPRLGRGRSRDTDGPRRRGNA
jgi:hypothetical protein